MPALNSFLLWLIPAIASVIGTLVVLLGRTTLGAIRGDIAAQGGQAKAIKEQLDKIETEFGRRLERFELAVAAIGREVGEHGTGIEGLVATLADLKGSLGRVEDSLREVMSQVGDHAASLAEGGVMFRDIRERLDALEKKLSSVAEKGCAQYRSCRPPRNPDDSQP